MAIAIQQDSIPPARDVVVVEFIRERGGPRVKWTSLTDPYGLGKASWKRLRRQLLTDACTMTIMLPRRPPPVLLSRNTA